MLIFFWISASLLAIFLLFGIPKILNIYKTYKWVKIPCRVESLKEIDSVSTKNGVYYNMQIEYSYEYKGIEYRSGKYYADQAYIPVKEEAVNSFTDKYQKDPCRTCYVNPDNCQEAVMEKGFQTGEIVLFLFMSFILLSMLIFSTYELYIRK